MDAQRRSLLSLAGLSVGDALGERFFGPPGQTISRIEARELPPAPWQWTDDTQMALSITELLAERGSIDQYDLADKFAERYEPGRGYGAGAHDLLDNLRRGIPWSDAAPAMFGGQGSYGNGAAMRVAPLGAYFAGDVEKLVAQATLSAEVTHAHAEGISGAIAVALAAAWAWKYAEAEDCAPTAMIDAVLRHTPESETRQRLAVVREISSSTHPGLVAERVGSGQEVAAHDTVPFAIWCAAHHLNDFEEAFWTTVSGLGDRDTTCAIVGGIVALSSRRVPPAWLASREPLPQRLEFNW